MYRTIGANATARVASEGPKNDLVFTALRPGAAYNDFTVRFVAQTAGVTVPTLVYDANARTLEFRIIAGTTKASERSARALRLQGRLRGIRGRQ